MVEEWCRYLPTPKVVHCDDEGVYASERFKGWCSDRTVSIKTCAGEAHWQHGIVERHIQTFKNILTKLFLDDRFNENDAEYVVDRATEAKNRHGAYGGHSPSQWFHGVRHPWLNEIARASMCRSRKPTSLF